MVYTEEDEWEYEYDENETEDFYIPIDVANVPELQTRTNAPSQPAGHPTLLNSKLRAFYANRKELEISQAPVIPPEGEESASMGEIQVVGLHTSNPLIMYNGQLLSCQWVSAIGTDMLFAKPDPESNGEDGPLKSLPDVDLIATSSARLVAQVGRLRPKWSLIEKEQTGTSGSAQNHSFRTMDEQSESTTVEARREQVVEPAPSSFLAKLNAAKVRRGETTRLLLLKHENGVRLVAAEDSEFHSSDEYSEDSDTTMTGT
jgi:hypothetical protein